MTDTPTLAPVRMPFKAARPLEQSLRGLMALVNNDDKNKEDLHIGFPQMEVTNRRTLALPTKNGTQEFGFSPDSFERLANLLGIPAKFVAEQPVTGRGSQQDILNSRIEQEGAKTALVRVRHAPSPEGLAGIIRTVLPGDYVPFDHRHMIAAISRAMQEHKVSLEVQSSTIGDPRALEKGLHLRLLSGDETLSLLGDDHKAGIHAYTSEVLTDHVDVSALLWRLVCSNGLMGWRDAQVLHQRHDKVQTHEISALVIEASFASLRKTEAIQETVERMASRYLDDPIAFLLGPAARKMKLSDGFTDLAKATYESDFKNEAQPTVYHVMQAFTRAAGSLPLSERPKLEAKIGNFFLG